MKLEKILNFRNAFAVMALVGLVETGYIAFKQKNVPKTLIGTGLTLFTVYMTYDNHKREQYRREHEKF